MTLPDGVETVRDAEAQFKLARDLLSGSDASVHFQRGIALIDEAAAAGLAAATELCGVFEAMGVGRPQSWDRAFDRLRLAAEQGSQSAQGQVLLLADSTREPLFPSAPPADFWAKTRARISLDKLLRHGERQALSNTPRIRVIERFASASECRWIMERARGLLKPALVFDEGGAHKIDPSRSNTGTDFQIPDMDLVLEVVRARISAATNIPLPAFELTQVLRYLVGQEFKAHVDFLDHANPHHQHQLRFHGQRIATFLIYLNEEFEGGETEFPQADVRFRGRTGDAIFWANADMDGRPEPLSLHAGLPPTSGEKWVLSQWIRDRAGPQQ